MRSVHGIGGFARAAGIILAAATLGGGLALAAPLAEVAGAATPNTAASAGVFAPDAATKPAWNTYYFGVEQNIPFCYQISVTGSGSMLPLTSMTAGTTPSGMTNYGLENINLAAGSAQICGTDTNAASTTQVKIAPVATNGGGSATLSATTADYGACSWTASGATTKVFDSNQDLDVTGSQASFGSAVTGGATLGSTSVYATCTDAYVPSLGAATTNMANPLPSPTDTNPSASQSDLASSNLELNKGCFGAIEIGGSSSYSFGSGTAVTIPTPWVNGGDCSYGGLGSNEAGGNTDSFATCPPTQSDVNIGYVDCSDTASSGDTSTNFNFSTDDILFTGQPVPQQSTATMSVSTANPGTSVTVTGGSNWWGNSGGAPNTGPYGDFQSGAMYQVSAPGVFIGTSRATAVPVINSNVTISANNYVCTGAESSTVGPNPCTMTPGKPSGSFQIPSGLAPGSYNLYIDESNTTPLPGNGPNDSYQTARGTSLGTTESSTPITIKDSSTDTDSPTTSSIMTGSSDTDTATITGSSTPDPTGTVTFYECGPASTPAPCTSGSWTEVSAQSLGGTSNPGTVVSSSFKPNATGEWCFTSVYSGDSNYLSSSDTTSDGCFAVNGADSAVTNAPAIPSITLGGSDSDSATVTGSVSGIDPTGSVTFYECGPDTSASPCTSGSWTSIGSESLGGTTNPDTVSSASFSPGSSGYWCFASVYSGDSNYLSGSDTTTDGCFDVIKVPAPTITSLSPASGKVGATVTIKGTNLGGATKVMIGTKVATIVSGSDKATQLKIKVPTGAKTGKIKVTTAGGTATSKTNFKVT
jgi:hypothetical protein